MRGATSEAMLQVWVEGEKGEPRAPGDLRITLLRHGEPVRDFEISPSGATADARLMLVQYVCQRSESVIETDQVRLELLDESGQVKASETIDATGRWRNKAMRTLEITASILQGGGASPLAGVKVRVADRTLSTPVLLSLPLGTTVSVSAPEDVQNGRKESAPFVWWHAFKQPFAGWENRKPLAGEHQRPNLRIVLDQDTQVELQYGTPGAEPDAPNLLRKIPDRGN